jgi:hypothetical protein
MSRDYSEEELHDPPVCREHGLQLIDKDWDEDREVWRCGLCEPLDD